MFPRIHLGTLMTVTDNHVAEKKRKRKKAVMEARVSRSMEGFYIYQTYLKRLRRMHRAYIAKYKKQQAQSLPPFSSSPWSQSDASHSFYPNKPVTNHRLSLAGAFRERRHQNSPETTDISSSQHPLQEIQEDPETDCHEGDFETSIEHRLKAIRIPCGREESMDLITGTHRFGPGAIQRRSDSDSRDNEHLPFRLWKRNGMKSLYKQPSNSNNDGDNYIHPNKATQPPRFVPKIISNNPPRLRINFGYKV